MPFKIVQTIENGILNLAAVPTLWERKGILRWPPKHLKQSSKLIQDDNSRPGPDWDTIKCVLKRNHILTYEKANTQIIEMQQNTDTEQQEHENFSVPSTSHPNNADIIDFEDMAQQLINPQTDVNDTPMETRRQGNIEAALAIIFDKLNVIIENQTKIAHKVASLSVQLDETCALISQQNQRPLSVTFLQDSLNMDENESFNITPIENEQQFDIFETNLVDKTHKKKLFKLLSHLCSPSTGSGTTCAYKLLDIIISRDFLCQCSWSGGSKGDVSKIPLKKFNKFGKFFFEMVHSWDSNFTDDNATKFLKLVVRNETKRRAMKGLRKSSMRTRKNKNLEGNHVGSGEQKNDANDKNNVRKESDESEGNVGKGPDVGGGNYGANTEVGVCNDVSDEDMDL